MTWEYVFLFVLLFCPILLMFGSMAFTLIHAWEELSGEGGPLWENFGRIVGVQIPLREAFLLFAVALPMALMGLAVLGYSEGSEIAISLLLGARVGDTLISHWGLRATNFSNPNPGIYSTAYYVVEAIWIVSFFKVSILYALLGGAFFAAVLPTMWLAGRIFPSWRE